MDVKKVVVMFFVTVLLSVVAKDICARNATCIVLEKCEGLYNRFMRDRSESVRNLLRKLHCGFDSPQAPKICCPPELKEVNVFIRMSTDQNPMDLLPNLKVCGIQNNDRIVGGTQTELDEHPWMALLHYDKPKGSGFYCGGVLIASRYVLTAAHCVKGADLPKTWKLSEVRLGEWNVTSKNDCDHDDCSPQPLNVPIEEIIAHEDYDPTDGQQQNDIALLRLAQDVTFNGGLSNGIEKSSVRSGDISGQLIGPPRPIHLRYIQHLRRAVLD
ncbi:unnamed protein product [Euphydryas editha]|uniref:CLIP domain-containing serine protease n=1 Tax=Euphydryas editha TaxID=104508 RepID=A0AAU9U9K6_EUPED|nr:unnamed protein product [Euphydryas editha]